VNAQRSKRFSILSLDEQRSFIEVAHQAADIEQ
jgi:hypothetical protein